MRKALIVVFISIYLLILVAGFIFELNYDDHEECLNEYWTVNEELDLKDALIKFTNQSENSAYQVKYFSGRIISLKVDYLHRTPNIYINIDMKTGQEIILGDIFRCRRYKEMLSDYICKNYGEKVQKSLIHDSKYFFTEDGIVVVIGDDVVHNYTIPKEIVGRQFKARDKTRCFRKFFKLN